MLALNDLSSLFQYYYLLKCCYCLLALLYACFNNSARTLLDESLVTILHDADRVIEPHMEEAFDTVI
jgi:hypothetical protein